MIDQIPSRPQLPRGEQDRDRDGEIEAPAILRQIGGGEVDGDASGGELEARVDERRAHPFFALLHFGAGEPDQREAGQTGTEVRLDLDRRRSEPDLRSTGDAGERHSRDLSPQDPAGRATRVRRSGVPTLRGGLACARARATAR